jgi:hypothetical protein
VSLALDTRVTVRGYNICTMGDPLRTYIQYITYRAYTGRMYRVEDSYSDDPVYLYTTVNLWIADRPF